MINQQLFRGQFLLTSEPVTVIEWNRIEISNLNLYYHHELEYSFFKTRDSELHLLGELYDWEIPALTNQQILEKLSFYTSPEELLSGLSGFSGQYVLIYNSQPHLIICNDPCGQHEIYYDNQITTFATQPKLLGKAIDIQTDDRVEAKSFLESDAFNKKKLFVGNSTHLSNVYHLQPNHYIDITKKTVKRFFPYSPLQITKIEEAATKAAGMLSGYIKAASFRNPLTMAVTAGYDSRVLFLASLEVKCEYFVYKHHSMNDHHYDITIPRQLTALHGKNFNVIPDIQNYGGLTDSHYDNSIDFPRQHPRPDYIYNDHIYLNGNISEIARNYYGYHNRVTPEDLAFLIGYHNQKLAIEAYKSWLESSAQVFQAHGYHLLDMFYWEEKMGIWAAKAKTEARALGQHVFSPFCSRDLLVTLLSTERKMRDSYHNKLYDQIISTFSPDALELPVNPGKKQKLIRIMKTAGIYNLYRHLGVKYRFLKFL